MRRIHDLLGREVNLDACNRALRDFAQSQRADTTGAVHVTCSDECEREEAESFQQWVADSLLPELKFSARSPFRSANLGARYEWGAVRIAEEHYATPSSRDTFKLMLVKINSHVAALESVGETVFGKMNRYDTNSTCCGALGALLAGTRHPAMDEIRMAFSYDDIPRLEMLRDADTIDPALTPFVAAILNARIQARSAIVDIQDFVPQSPTVTVVMPTVTINRPQRDTEFVVGLYWADSRKGVGEAEYVGLGDDPSKYVISTTHGYLRVEDNHLQQPREARDHRELVVKQYRNRHGQTEFGMDERWQQVIAKSQDDSAKTPQLAQETLKTVLWLAADIAPIPLAVMLFAKGIVGIHHLYRVHRLARGSADSAEAREIIAEVSDQVTKLPVDRARETVQSIMAHFKA